MDERNGKVEIDCRIFEKETIFTKWLHNFIVFAIQRRFYNKGIPFVILPIRV